MRIAIALVMLNLTLGAIEARSACFYTAAKFTPPLLDHYVALDTNIAGADLLEVGLAMGLVMGVIDVYTAAGQICFPEPISQGDAMTLVVRHFKAVMDKRDARPTQTCAQSVIAEIFMERFPCPAPTTPKSSPPAK